MARWAKVSLKVQGKEELTPPGNMRGLAKITYQNNRQTQADAEYAGFLGVL